MKHTISNSLIIFSFLLMVAGCMSSCNAEKRAVKHIHKAVRIDLPTVNKYFSDNYNITDSTDVRVIYKQGLTVFDTVVNTEVEVINDTVYLKEVKVVTVKTTDTLDRSSFERKQNNAVIRAMQDHQNKLNQALHESETEKELYKADAKRVKNNNTTLWLIIACYVALKFIMLWLSAKFPANRIIGVARKIL